MISSKEGFKKVWQENHKIIFVLPIQPFLSQIGFCINFCILTLYYFMYLNCMSPNIGINISKKTKNKLWTDNLFDTYQLAYFIIFGWKRFWKLYFRTIWSKITLLIQKFSKSEKIKKFINQRKNKSNYSKIFKIKENKKVKTFWSNEKLSLHIPNYQQIKDETN